VPPGRLHYEEFSFREARSAFARATIRGRDRTREATMKTDIHPNYVVAQVRCTCGNEFTTRSTNPEIKVEICSNCHPFYTGRQKLVDSGGRVDRFQRKLARRQKS
jgi:large subunit ribosomal protein L31